MMLLYSFAFIHLEDNHNIKQDMIIIIIIIIIIIT